MAVVMTELEQGQLQLDQLKTERALELKKMFIKSKL